MTHLFESPFLISGFTLQGPELVISVLNPLWINKTISLMFHGQDFAYIDFMPLGPYKPLWQLLRATKALEIFYMNTSNDWDLKVGMRWHMQVLKWWYMHYHNVMHAPIIAYNSMLISYSLVKAKPFGKCQHSLFRRFIKNWQQIQ